MNDELIGFLSRLRKDTRGNVMAMAAAMILPMIGLVGGAVDMSRLYATKTRLQAACDAGALAGRRTMGVGTWAANSGAANTQAGKVFTLNFQPGAFASENQSAAYTEANGTVTGNAQADVPMTLMKVFGTPTSTVRVSCTSMMVIPNTDVMFVLDTTGSMNDPDSSGVAKITGLKKATKCFYEALARENTDAICERTGTTDTPPSGGISSAVQLRFGFMPYATNVNVGKLLPNKYFADNWFYQSRTVNAPLQWGWTAGTLSSITGYSAWSPTSTPSSFDTSSGYSNFSRISTSTVTVGSTTYDRLKSSATSSNCNNENTLAGSSSSLVARSDIGEAASDITDDVVSQTTPTYPATEQVFNYSRTDTRTVSGYRYRWFNPPGSDPNGCWLESASGSYNRTSTGGQAKKPLTWTQFNPVTGFTYNQISLNVSGLKAGGSTWNDTIALPLGTQSTTIKASGSNANATIPADITATWNGCIEDAYEPQNVTWANGIPSTAYGAKIDLVPDASNSQTLWAPVLSSAVWGRYDGSGSWTRNAVTTSNELSRNHNVACPSEAAKLKKWDAEAFQTYVNDLSTGGNTYHDIGLVWGGRFLSPDGIFHDENWQTSEGASIYRHLVFMTDGDTSTSQTNYTSQGVAWWDRRQTSGTNDSDLTAVVNARFAAICTSIKAKGIVIWVISYGNGTNTTTDTNLRNCSSDSVINNTTTGESTRFFKAANSDNLISTFKSIANQISSLRLTS